jgi:hypothetical protein
MTFLPVKIWKWNRAVFPFFKSIKMSQIHLSSATQPGKTTSLRKSMEILEKQKPSNASEKEITCMIYNFNLIPLLSQLLTLLFYLSLSLLCRENPSERKGKKTYKHEKSHIYGLELNAIHSNTRELPLR